MNYLPVYRRPQEFRPEHYQHITDDRWWWFFVIAPWDRRHWRSLTVTPGRFEEDVYFGPGQHPPTFYALAEAVIEHKMPFANVRHIHAVLHHQYLAEDLFRTRVDRIINRWPYTALTGLDPRSAPRPLPPEPVPFEPVTDGSNIIPIRRKDD